MPRLKANSPADFAETVEETMLKLRNQSKNLLGKDHEITTWLREMQRKASSLAQNASTEPINGSDSTANATAK